MLSLVPPLSRFVRRLGLGGISIRNRLGDLDGDDEAGERVVAKLEAMEERTDGS